MKKLSRKILKTLAGYFNEKKYNRLKLKAIKIKNGTMNCEFNELLSLDGRLIRVPVSEVFKNRDLQSCISPSHLLVIGSSFGSHCASLTKLQLRKIDLQEMSVILESSSERISVKISNLLLDSALVNQLNPIDLVRIMSIYLPEQERNMMHMLKHSGLASSLSDHSVESNVVPLF